MAKSAEKLTQNTLELTKVTHFQVNFNFIVETILVFWNWYFVDEQVTVSADGGEVSTHVTIRTWI